MIKLNLQRFAGGPSFQFFFDNNVEKVEVYESSENKVATCTISGEIYPSGFPTLFTPIIKIYFKARYSLDKIEPNNVLYNASSKDFILPKNLSTYKYTIKSLKGGINVKLKNEANEIIYPQTKVDLISGGDGKPLKTETWTFTLEDGSIITKEVVVK